MSNRRREFTVEVAGADEASFLEVFDLLLEEHKEVACHSLDVQKAATACYSVLAQGMTFVARDADGVAIGHLALKEVVSWYSQESALYDGWFYVRPEHRAGNVGVALMRAARAVGQERNKLVFIMTANPHRRPKKTSMTLMAQMAGFIPVGYLIKIKG